MTVYQVQAQMSGVTVDGWESSRQAPTIKVAADSALEAARIVSDFGWTMSQERFQSPRHTYAHVIEVAAQTPDFDTWVRVTYRYGFIHAVTGDTYESVKYREGK